MGAVSARLAAVAAWLALGCGEVLVPGSAALPLWNGDELERPGVRARATHGTLLIDTETAHSLERCETACTDDDRDGLVDAFEAVLLDRLRPVVFLHPDEPLLYDADARVGAVGRVATVAGRPERVRVFIALAYHYDYGLCGVSSHVGDSERVALDVVVTPHGTGTRAVVTRVYTAGHEGASGDTSAIVSGTELELIGRDGGVRWVVYAARAKHATYSSVAACGASGGMCLGDQCAAGDALLMPIVNAGEPRAPLPDLGDFAFDPDTVWSGARFCGDRPADPMPCTSPLRDKLVRDPFD